MRPASPPEIEITTRRHFFIGAIYGLWTAIGAALGIPALIYLMFPPKARQNDEWVAAGDLSRIAPNTPMEVTFRRNRVDGWKVTSEKSTAWVVKDASNHVAAFGPQCTHLGCAVRYAHERLECPCHLGFFEPDRGFPIQGPPSRPLAAIALESRPDGSLWAVGELPKPTVENPGHRAQCPKDGAEVSA